MYIIIIKKFVPHDQVQQVWFQTGRRMTSNYQIMQIKLNYPLEWNEKHSSLDSVVMMFSTERGEGLKVAS